MKYIIGIILILCLIGVQLTAVELNKVMLGIEIFDTIINSDLEGDYLYSTDQIIAVKSGIELGLTDDLIVTFNSVVYGFAIKIFDIAPSSVDWKTILIHRITPNLTMRLKHHCWHYLKQFPKNLGLDSNSLTLEYRFD